MLRLLLTAAPTFTHGSICTPKTVRIVDDSVLVQPPLALQHVQALRIRPVTVSASADVPSVRPSGSLHMVACSHGTWLTAAAAAVRTTALNRPLRSPAPAEAAACLRAMRGGQHSRPPQCSGSGSPLEARCKMEVIGESRWKVGTLIIQLESKLDGLEDRHVLPTNLDWVRACCRCFPLVLMQEREWWRCKPHLHARAAPEHSSALMHPRLVTLPRNGSY